MSSHVLLATVAVLTFRSQHPAHADHQGRHVEEYVWSTGSCSDSALYSAESSDPEFEDYARRFASLETAAEKLLKDTKAFDEAVTNLFTAGAGFAHHFATLFHPLASESDLWRNHPEAEHTLKNVDGYEGVLEELKASVVPELELIQSRVAAPIKELQGIMKLIRKSITKREHKVRSALAHPRSPLRSASIACRL